MTRSPAPLLEVEHLTMRFGGLVAVNDVSFTAMKQQITAIIGPNGAGKTTMFNCLTGFYRRPSAGWPSTATTAIFLLERLDAFRISQKAAVARTFQNIRLFAHMSVLENLIVAQHNKLMKASGFTVAGLLGLPVYRKAEKAGGRSCPPLARPGSASPNSRLGRRQPALWRPAPAGDRPRHVHRAGPAVPGRTCRRSQPARIGRSVRAAHLHPRRATRSASC